MINFRNTNILFAFILVLLMLAGTTVHVPFYVYLLTTIIYSLVVFWGCYYVGSGFFIRIVCSATTDKKQIAISFDDGPAVEYTPGILQVLKDNNVQATFFCIGNRIAGNEALLQRIVEGGHIIGNHSFTHHFWFDLYSAKKMVTDLSRMDDELHKVIGLRPRLFRPPYGVTNPNVKKAVESGNYIPVGWSVRSMDTVISDDNKLLRGINARLKPGAVFLFHDTSRTTLNVLQAFLVHARQQGYEIIRLDKLLNLQAYA